MTERGMVLAAGFGTRLRPLTEELPKPLIPVANRPLVGFSLAQLARAGVDQVAINVHHRAERLTEALGDGASWGVDITWSVEDEILGTGGGVARMRPFLDQGTFFLLNGDVLSSVDLAQVLVFHRSRGVGATMVVRPMPQGADFTPLQMDEAGYLVGFKGITQKPSGAVRPVMFCGVHVLEPSLFDYLPPTGFSCINDRAYTALLEQGLKVGAYLYEGPWFDLGTPERYLEASAALLSGAMVLPEDAETGFEPSSSGVLVHPLAQVDPSAQLGPRVSVGAGCTIGARSRIEESILWPGARVEADQSLARVILSAQNRVDV